MKKNIVQYVKRNKSITLIGITSKKNSLLYKSSNLKLYREISENREIPKKNWKLMSLGYRNLSADQILRVNSILENSKQNKNKLEFIREKNRAGINNFDIERYFLSIRNLNNE